MKRFMGTYFVKLLSVMLVMVLTFTLFGCGKSSKQSVEETSGTQASPAPTQEVTQAPTATPVPTQAPAQESTGEKTDINIAALKGPTAMGMVKIMEDSSNGETANNYKFTIAGTPDEISGGLVKGDYNMAAIPCNLASVLYNKSKGQVVVAGINTLGVLYVVEEGNTISSVSDLKGKTIYSTGKGATPEYTLNYILSANGLDPAKDVKVEYKSEATEVASLLSKSKNAIAVLPQPYVATVMMNNDQVRIALDLTKEWEKVSKNDSTVVTGVLAVNKSFLDKNKDAVDAFLKEYEASAAYVNENQKDAAALIEKFDIFKAAVALKAIPYSNITFIQGDEMQTKISGYLEALFEQNPQAVGGTMPDEAFYYKQ